MQPQAKPQKDRGKEIDIHGGDGLAFEGFPAYEVRGEGVKNMEQKKEIKGDGQDIFVELFSQSLVHDVLGDPESRDNEKKHEGEQDPAAVAVDHSKHFRHQTLLPSSMKNGINFVNKKDHGGCHN